VNNARNCGCNEPRKTEEPADHVEEAIEEEIPVVGFAVLQVVVWIVDQVPGNTIVEVNKKEDKNSGSSSHDRDPSLVVQVAKCRKPRTYSRWGDDFFVFVGPKTRAGRIAASICWLELVGDVEALNFNAVEAKLLNNGEDKDSNRHGEVVYRVPDALIAKETSSFEATEEEDRSCCSETQEDAEQGSLQVAVVVVLVVFLEVLIQWLQVKQEEDGEQ